MTKKTLLLNATILLPQLVVAQSAELNEAYKKYYGEYENCKISKDSPNILLITSDQHHWMAMGYNDPKCKTPNLDRLASKGVIFDKAYTCNPVSTPSRASIITGRYPSQHGAYALGTKLPETELCIGDCLSECGYETAPIFNLSEELPNIRLPKRIRFYKISTFGKNFMVHSMDSTM